MGGIEIVDCVNAGTPDLGGLIAKMDTCSRSNFCLDYLRRPASGWRRTPTIPAANDRCRCNVVVLVYTGVSATHSSTTPKRNLL